MAPETHNVDRILSLTTHLSFCISPLLSLQSVFQANHQSIFPQEEQEMKSLNNSWEGKSIED